MSREKYYLLLYFWFQMLCGLIVIFFEKENRIITKILNGIVNNRSSINPPPHNSVFFAKYLLSQDPKERAKYVNSIKYVWEYFLKPVSPDSLSDCSEGRFLVYQCRKQDRHDCGGLADRERGIISTFLLALQTNRTFVIDLDKPCELEQFLVPNLYNWTRCKSFIQSLPVNESKTLHMNNRRKEYPKLFNTSPTSEISSSNGPKVLNFQVNMAPLQRILSENDFQKRVPWLKDFTIREIIVIIYSTLFVPSGRVIAALDNLKSKQKNNLLQCAHIRYGQSVDIHQDKVVVHERGRFNTTALSSFFIRNAQDRHMESSVYIATDSSAIHRQMESRHKNYIRLSTTISHIDYSNSCEGHYSAILDQLALTQCDVLVLSFSGFGSLAAYLRGVDTGLYQCHSSLSKTPGKITNLTIEDDMRNRGYFIYC